MEKRQGKETRDPFPTAERLVLNGLNGGLLDDFPLGKKRQAAATINRMNPQEPQETTDRGPQKNHN